MDIGEINWAPDYGHDCHPCCACAGLVITRLDNNSKCKDCGEYICICKVG